MDFLYEWLYRLFVTKVDNMYERLDIYKFKKGVLFCLIFLFFYYLNMLTPICFGDDYVYSFVWEGHSMFEPMTEQARRLSSFHDLLVSQWSHYLTGNGRAVSHTIVQFFLWVGKDIFNIFNAFISVLLIMEIYWCANKGRVTVSFKTSNLVLIFFALWAFTPSFPSVFLWLSGACNYLWPAVFLLGFLLPYIRKYYFLKNRIDKNRWFRFVMFFTGVIAGWSNENSVCWIILVILVFICKNSKRSEIETWMITGLAGMIIGYALLMLAPGNFARLAVETKAHKWFTWEAVAKHAALLFLVFVYFHIILWYFNLRSFYSLRVKFKENSELAKEVLFTKSLCMISFCMTFMMLFSPNFQTRSAFPGTILLIIAASILLRVQVEYSIILIRESTKKFLCIVGIMYFAITTTASIYGSHYYREQIDELISFVKSSEHAKHNVIVIGSLHPVHDAVSKLSYFHLINFKLSSNENDWRNVAFSRYYGIKGIRMVKEQEE